MAEQVEVVIKIPKYYLTHPQDYSCLAECVRRGVLLPKGHGRIADMDAAIKCIKDVEGEDAVWAISLIEWACAKRIIIEADKESEG